MWAKLTPALQIKGKRLFSVRKRHEWHCNDCINAVYKKWLCLLYKSMFHARENPCGYVPLVGMSANSYFTLYM